MPWPRARDGRVLRRFIVILLEKTKWTDGLAFEAICDAVFGPLASSLGRCKKIHHPKNATNATFLR
jgi:hypothetical protein